MSTTYNKLGYVKVDRQKRHEFWRDTYRAAFQRRVIGIGLQIVLLAIAGYVFVVLAFQSR